MREENVPDFNPLKFKDLHTDNNGYFTDPESNKVFILPFMKKNFMEKFEGFCPTCNRIYSTRWEISAPNTKILMGTRCHSYWNSIDPNIPSSHRGTDCGHDVSHGWNRSFQEI